MEYSIMFIKNKTLLSILLTITKRKHTTDVRVFHKCWLDLSNEILQLRKLVINTINIQYVSASYFIGKYVGTYAYNFKSNRCIHDTLYIRKVTLQLSWSQLSNASLPKTWPVSRCYTCSYYYHNISTDYRRISGHTRVNKLFCVFCERQNVSLILR